MKRNFLPKEEYAALDRVFVAKVPPHTGMILARYDEKERFFSFSGVAAHFRRHTPEEQSYGVVMSLDPLELSRAKEHDRAPVLLSRIVQKESLQRLENAYLFDAEGSEGWTRIAEINTPGGFWGISTVTTDPYNRTTVVQQKIYSKTWEEPQKPHYVRFGEWSTDGFPMHSNAAAFASDYPTAWEATIALLVNMGALKPEAIGFVGPF